MIRKLKIFFEQHLSVVSIESETDIEHRLQLASAVLLLEVAQADREFSAIEKVKVQESIQTNPELIMQ